jgi:hypothetical protein
LWYVTCLYIAGVDWSASYEELANFAEGRRSRSAFEGLPITSLFDMSGASIIWGANGSSSGGGGSWEFRLSGLLPAANAPAALHDALAAAAGAGANCCSSNGSRMKCRSGPQDLDADSPTHHQQQQQRQQSYGGACYSLNCRLAISDGLDESQPFYIGVPSWLALSEDNTWGRNFFFAQLELQQPDGALQQLNPAAVAAACSASQQQQQQVHAQRPFEGDSVEQLMTVTAEMFKQLKQGGATAAGEVALSSSNGSSSSSSAPVWLPRGIAQLSSDSSSSSICSVDPSVVSAAASSVTNSTSSSAGTQHQHQQQMGSAGSVRSTTSSSAAASSITTSGVAGSVVCRGLPVPGLVMGPLVGRGSYGRVYRGLLKGRPVAVKVGMWWACLFGVLHMLDGAVCVN